MTIKANPISVMASFATFKSMAECKKYRSQYQILAEFIEYIIYKESLFSFIDNQIKHHLQDYFGFDVPEAVIRTAMRSLSYVSCQDRIYTVDHTKLNIDNEIEQIKEREEEKNATVIEALQEFIRNKGVEDIDAQTLTQQLVSYLLEEEQIAPGQCVGLISQFILLNEKNERIQQQLNAIREGCILYVGLNHNISEVGSIGKTLTLYLDTEVLFDLMGYNGEICRLLALDFFAQVRKANASKGNVILKYFKDVGREIEDFFKSAEYIADRQSPYTEKEAMRTILNGCDSSADVKQKKADFDYRLRFEFGIYEDTIENYYTPELEEYNLERTDVTDPKDQESWKFISHIHKLRKGEIFPDTLTAEYVFVTKTYNTLRRSQELVEHYKIEKQLATANDYAVSINGMTSLLWYKLGGGFGHAEYPNSIRAILKARIILASYISHNIEKEFNEAQRQFKAGEITEEQLAYRVITLRKKPTLPEELEGDSIEESLNFSAEYLRRFEEEVRTNKTAIEEKNKEIEKLLQKNEEEKQQKDNALSEIAALTSRLDEIQRTQDKEREKKENRKKALKYAIRLVLFAVLLGLAVWLAYYVNVTLESPILTIVVSTIEAFCAFYGGWQSLVKGYRKLFPKDTSNSESGDANEQTEAGDNTSPEASTITLK